MQNQNLWLAEMGYLTMQRIMAPHVAAAGYPPTPPLDEIPELVRTAWIAAAAAIRRRVVIWGLSAEQEDVPLDVVDISTSVAEMHSLWRWIPAEERMQFLTEMLTPAERYRLCCGPEVERTSDGL